MAASDLLTPAEAAAEYRVSIGTVYNLIAAHKLPVIRFGKQYRINKHSLAALVAMEARN
jgi:excisionase family DNA binding protein